MCAPFRVEQLLGIESIDNVGIFRVRRAVFNGLWIVEVLGARCLI